MRRSSATNLLLLSTVSLGMWLADHQPVSADETMPPKITYEDHVKPIFRQKCFTCHDSDKKEGDLDLTNYTNLMQGGGSGSVVEAGDSSGSYLYRLVTHEEEPHMPPESPKIADEMTDTIRDWIDGGLLESAASKAVATKKKTYDLALQDVSTERPEVVPMPARLSLQPVARTPATTAVSALATSPWAPLVAVAGQRQVLLYNTQTLDLLGTLPFPEGIPHVLKFSRNGNLLLAGGGQGGASGKAIVWNVQNGQRIFEVGDELDAVLAADISSDQALIALGGPQRVVRVYSTETGQLVYELRKHTDWIYSLEFSPDSVLLATGDRAGNLFVWEGWTGREYLTLKGHGGSVTGVSWRSDSNVLASCSEDGSIRLWEMENGGQIKNWGAHGGGVASIEFARDGRILSCGRDRVTKVWDQNGGQQRALEAFGDLALRASICDETNRAIAGDWNGEIRVWNVADGARIGELTANPLTIAERLDEAAKQLAARQTEYQTLTAAYQVAQAAADKATADADAAQRDVEMAQKQLDAATTNLEVAKKAVAQTSAALDAARGVVAQLEPAVPTLKEAVAKAAEAAKKLSGDEQLAETLAKLKAVADSRSAQLETNRQAAVSGAETLQSAQAQLAGAEKAAAAAESKMRVARQQAEKLAPLVSPVVDKATAARQVADQVAAAVTEAQRQVARWRDEIAFHDRLTQLQQQLAAASEQLAQQEQQLAEHASVAQQAQTTLEKAMAEAAAAEQAILAAEVQVEAATAAVDLAKQRHASSVADHQAAIQSAAQLETVIATLNEAVAKTQEAATISAGDKALVELVTKLKNVAGGKQAALESAIVAQDAQAKAVDEARQQAVAAEEPLAAAKTTRQAAQQRVAELAAAIPPAEKKSATAQNEADAAAAAVAAAQEDIDRLRNEIATAQGLETNAN